MPTPSEQKALAFLAFVLLLGGAARVLHAGSPPLPTAGEQQALARQAAVAESVGHQQRVTKGRNGAKVPRLRRDIGADTVAGVASVPFQDVRPGRRDGWINGYPPPSPRVDVGGHAPGTPAVAVASVLPIAGDVPPAPLVDLDRASAAEIDALPRIGPAMAGRIVANRDSFGPFGSLEALRRVRGIGPGTLKNLATRVTFSGHPASAAGGGRTH